MSQTIFKRRANRFTPIANAAIRDPNLKLEDKGFLIWVLSLPETWLFNRTHAMKELGCGRDKMDACIKRLRERGYCDRRQERDEQGRMGSIVYKFTDIPFDFGDDEPLPAFPETGMPKTGNKEHIKREDSSTKIKREKKRVPSCDVKARQERARQIGEITAKAAASASVLDVAERRWKASPSEIAAFRMMSGEACGAIATPQTQKKPVACVECKPQVQLPSTQL